MPTTTVRVARNAMGSRFEIVLEGDDAVALRAAGEQALAEIERLDAQMSTYKPSSEVSLINSRAARGPVQVEPTLFALLERARFIHQATEGAFDPTVGPLMQAWGFRSDNPSVPSAQVLAEARSRTGMHLVHLDRRDRTIFFEVEGVRLDLGAIGKGYALDEAAMILRDAGVEHALLQGGTSAILAVGNSIEMGNWNVAVPYPKSIGTASEQDRILSVVSLVDESLSVSAVWGRAFEANGKAYGHVMDPRTGAPLTGALLSAVVLPSAADADAVSTALLVLGRDGVEPARRHWPDARLLLVLPDDSERGFDVVSHGLELDET